MKGTTNVFQGGLQTDLHPLSVSQKQLTDALNATLITFNGNEMMLQNDMGNTRIQDSTTGNIMGLSEGFIPVGMKEYGGIMYIASVNNQGVGEIGTIPSPIYTLTSKGITPDTVNQIVASDEGPNLKYSILNNTKLFPGDRFVVWLDLQDPTDSTKNVFTEVISQTVVDFSRTPVTTSPILRPLISQTGGTKGLYNIQLYSVFGTGATQLTYAESTPQTYWIKGNATPNYSKYWFVPYNVTACNNFDVETTFMAKEFKSYPGVLPPGRLAIRAKLEGIDHFSLIKIKQPIPTAKQQETYAPAIVKQADGSYELIFMGYEYKSTSARFIHTIKSTLFNQNKSCKVAEWQSTEDKVLITYRHQTDLDTFQLRDVRTIGSYIWVDTTTDLVTNIASRNIRPLFTYNIGKELNTWYTITAEYYDQFGGVIGSYQYSFNPYHVLNYEVSYQYEWVPASPLSQRYNAGASATSKVQIVSGIEETIELNSAVLAAGNAKTVVGRGSYCSFDYDTNFGQDVFSADPWPGETDDSRKLIKELTLTGVKSSYEYLYKSNLFTQRRVEVTDSNIGSLWLSIKESNGLTPLYSSFSDLNSLYQWEWEIDGKTVSSCEAVNVTPPTGVTTLMCGGTEYYQGLSAKAPTSLDINRGIPGGKDNFQDVTVKLHFLTDAPNYRFYFQYPQALGFECEKDEWGNWSCTEPTEGYTLQGYVDQHNTSSTLTLKVDALSVNNKSVYSTVPYFSLSGSTDQKSGLTLGVNGLGQVSEAWSFGEDYLKHEVRKKIQVSHPNEFIPSSTFEYNPPYYYVNASDWYHKPDTCGQSDSIILEPGVYLLNLQIYSGPMKTGTGKGARTVHPNQVDLDTPYYKDMGPYTTYNTNTFSGQELTPEVGFQIGDSIYDVAKCDWDEGEGEDEVTYRTFLPTLIYIPSNQICKLWWRNVHWFNNMGLFKVAKSIILKDGTQFGKGNSPILWYYQHPSIKESRVPILPIKFSYFENAQCLNERYKHYIVGDSTKDTNIFVDTRNIKVYEEESTHEDLQNPTQVWLYNNLYIRDANKQAIHQFMYTWDGDTSNLTTTTFQACGDLRQETLTYRM